MPLPRPAGAAIVCIVLRADGALPRRRAHLAPHDVRDRELGAAGVESGAGRAARAGRAGVRSDHRGTLALRLVREKGVRARGVVGRLDRGRAESDVRRAEERAACAQGRTQRRYRGAACVGAGCLKRRGRQGEGAEPGCESHGQLSTVEPDRVPVTLSRDRVDGVEERAAQRHPSAGSRVETWRWLVLDPVAFFRFEWRRSTWRTGPGLAWPNPERSSATSY